MHPVLDDQGVYDIIFRLYRAILVLAQEANEARRQRCDMVIRALRAEARLRIVEIERDFWKQQVRRHALSQARYNRAHRKKAA